MNLNFIRDDFWAVLSAVPAEAPGVRSALLEGRVDGSTYEGACACLVGTVANLRGVDYRSLGALQPDAGRPIEMWFAAIKKGDTPDNNIHAKRALTWIDEWLHNVQMAFDPVYRATQEAADEAAQGDVVPEGPAPEGGA